jgi:uncharacterized protein YuzE
MRSVRITYDPEGDILYVTFGHPTEATGYQLSDQMLLRVNPQTQEVAGLTIRNFSVHTRTAQEILLSEIDEDPAVKPLLLQLLNSLPVTHFLHVIQGVHGISARLRHPSLEEALVG